MTDNVDPKTVSEVMKAMRAKRKNQRGGFNDPKVQAKILAKRKKNATKKTHP